MSRCHGLDAKGDGLGDGIPIANYIRLERGQHRNPPLGWLVNAATVLDCNLDELISDAMCEWYRSSPLGCVGY